jgi:hypothetical protein
MAERKSGSARTFWRVRTSSKAFHVRSECYNRVMKHTFLVFAALALTTPLIATAKSHKTHAAAKKPAAAETGATNFSVKGADGSVKNYQIEVPASLPAASGASSKISQQGAVLAALGWAPGFYGSTGTAATSAEFKTIPTPYYLVSLTGKIGDSTQQLYAAVLEDGRIVRPSVTTGAPEKHVAKSKKSKK